MKNFFINNINLDSIKLSFKLVKDMPTYNRVKAFWHPIYQKLYPDVPQLDIDPGDQNALVLYRENATDEIRSSFRIALDCDQGLPEERFLAQHLLTRRKQGMKIGEFGRLVNVDSIFGLKECYCSLYQIAKYIGIDTIVIVTSMQYENFYIKKIGAEQLCDDIGTTFGSDHVFGAFAWDLAKTNVDFFKWTGIKSQVNLAGDKL
ncbi:MAG: hypothetical protein K0U40_03485 [Betaproteobacteria bacterium]|nr:hypothetical protein [Betaproteobacteria bacterium]